jgi:ribose 5-phosphate isomerase B
MKTKGTIAIASDHAGFELKQELISFLKEEGYEVVDHGAWKKDEQDDYPDFVKLVARDVSRHADTLRGIVLGGSGTGEAIVCNRFPNVRAVSYYGGNVEIVSLSRKHNDANILSLGARFVGVPEAKMVIQEWLNTSFSGDERHVGRIEKIDKLFEDFL